MDGQESSLGFAQDGDDLIVSLSVVANNSPHVLWTDAIVQTNRVIPPGGSVADARPATRVCLMYCLIQNRDLYRRSKKTVDIKWRLTNRTHCESDEYVVSQCFIPKQTEWPQLAAKLNTLMAAHNR